MTSPSVVRSARLCILLLSAGWAACSSSEDSPSHGDGGVADDSEPAALADCSDEGATRACICESGTPGRKTCSKGTYGPCDGCSASPVDDRPSVVSVNLCKAGYYVGEMQGRYAPGFASLGITGSGFAVHFMSAEINGQPPLALTLHESETGSGEFPTYSVNGGCMQGLARSMGTDTPFVARLTGELNCVTGAFVGVMEGVYTLVGVEGFDYRFKGPITAQFVLRGNQLSDGAWSATEPPALDGMPAGGGSGTWGAAYVSDDAPDAGVDPCADIVTTGPLERDGGVAADGGV